MPNETVSLFTICVEQIYVKKELHIKKWKNAVIDLLLVFIILSSFFSETRFYS